MSWIKEHSLTWLQRVVMNVLKTGEIPKHLALILDGNRRFAQKQNLQRLEGHVHGFDKLSEVLFWCLELGITEVTVYAFSIENFKRSKEEVDGLMLLALEKIRKMLDEIDKIHEKGVCVRVQGNPSFLPVELQGALAEVVLQTRHNSRCQLNICLSYTSREELCHAVRDLADGVRRGLICPEDITEDVLGGTLYSRKGTDPDLLIRTSGEVRLSDFLLWQSGHSVLEFVSVLWPEFSVWHLFAATLCYQRQLATIRGLGVRRAEEGPRTDVESAERVRRFFDHVEQKWQTKLEDMKSGRTVQLPVPS